MTDNRYRKVDHNLSPSLFHWNFVSPHFVSRLGRLRWRKLLLYLYLNPLIFMKIPISMDIIIFSYHLRERRGAKYTDTDWPGILIQPLYYLVFQNIKTCSLIRKPSPIWLFSICTVSKSKQERPKAIPGSFPNLLVCLTLEARQMILHSLVSIVFILLYFLRSVFVSLLNNRNCTWWEFYAFYEQRTNYKVLKHVCNEKHCFVNKRIYLSLRYGRK